MIMRRIANDYDRLAKLAEEQLADSGKKSDWRLTLAPMVALSPRPARTVLIPVLIPHRLRILGPEQVLYSITKHAMRRSADEISATSISFRPKVFSDPASVVD